MCCYYFIVTYDDSSTPTWPYAGPRVIVRERLMAAPREQASLNSPLVIRHLCVLSVLCYVSRACKHKLCMQQASGGHWSVSTYLNIMYSGAAMNISIFIAAPVLYCECDEQRVCKWD
jgi:hypothetical protein